MPNPPTSTIDEFLGMATDRDGIEQDKGEFYNLSNVVNNKLENIDKRLGSRKFASQTSAPGTKTHGLFTYTDDAGTELYIKICQDGKLYKSTGSGAWVEITSGAPGGGFAAADAFFAQLSTRDTGAAASATGTLTSADSTTITNTSAALTVNAHTGRILSVASGEYKLIAANNATKIFAKERFDDIPTGTYNIYPRAIEFFIANGTNFYKCDGTTLTRLDNSVFATSFVGICAFGQRLFGWKGTRHYYSDGGVGEHFSRNSWQDFQSTIVTEHPLESTLLIYEKNRVTSQTGDSPDNYFYKEVLSGVGTTAPKSVATYTYMQFFLSPEYGVCVISSKPLAGTGQKSEPLSVSDQYINTDLLSNSAANIAAAAGYVHKGKYYLYVGTNLYVLHIDESMSAPRDKNNNIRWIWTKHDYPAAQDANVLGHYGTALVAGSAASGQVYELEVAGVYSDDGTAITRTIEKRDWSVTGGKEDKVYHSLKVSQPTSAAAIVENLYFDADGYSYGTPDGTYTLSTESSLEHDVKIPSSLTSPKDRGKRFSFKIEESGSLGSSPIEEIVLLFQPDVLV